MLAAPTGHLLAAAHAVPPVGDRPVAATGAVVHVMLAVRSPSERSWRPSPAAPVPPQHVGAAARSANDVRVHVVGTQV